MLRDCYRLFIPFLVIPSDFNMASLPGIYLKPEFPEDRKYLGAGKPFQFRQLPSPVPRLLEELDWELNQTQQGLHPPSAG